MCGDAAAFQQGGRLDDLPVCGPGEEEDPALREARAALLRADRLLQSEAADRAERDLLRAEEAVSGLDLKGRLAALAPVYQQAVAALRARARLVPELDGLRACQAHAQVLLRHGPPEIDALQATAPDVRAARAAVTRAEECVDLARRLSASRPIASFLAPGPLALSVEVAPGQVRRLQDLLEDVRGAHRQATAQLQAAQKGWEIVRGRWLRVVYGDRLRIFNQHPDDLPEYDGKARGPLPASVLPRWRYQLPDGRTEHFFFKGHKLINRMVVDPRRS